MTYENPKLALLARVAALNHRFEGVSTEEMLRQVLTMPAFGPLALVSSFGTGSVVLLHLVSRIAPDLPVIFLDTELLFAQTLTYQRRLAADLGLSDIRRITPLRTEVLRRDADNLLHRASPDACCALRKTEPLARALAGFDGWISGRKRFQAGQRQDLALFEAGDDQKIKLNPLAHWQRADLAAYIKAHDLPPHPLVAQGYPSVGCAPCTTPARAQEDERAGRWRGVAKTECGIHFKKEPRKQSVIVNDDGFAEEDWAFGFHPVAALSQLSEAEKMAVAVDLPNDFDPQDLLPWLPEIDLIRVSFPVFSDGRGFSLAQQLRLLGYVGRLRAKGDVLADQYPMLRHAGFDEAEITQSRAARQPVAQWQVKTGAPTYQQQLM